MERRYKLRKQTLSQSMLRTSDSRSMFNHPRLVQRHAKPRLAPHSRPARWSGPNLAAASRGLNPANPAHAVRSRFAHAPTGTTLPDVIPSDGGKQRAGSLFRTVGVSHLGVCVDLGRELLVALGGRLDGAVAGVPVGGADFAVLVGELEGVNEAEGFVDRATNGQVVDGDLGWKLVDASSPVACRRRSTSHSVCCVSPLASPPACPSSAHLSHNAIRINDEQPPQRNALVLNQHTVVLAELVVLVAQERNVDLAQPSIPPARVRPRKQTVLGVGGREHDLCVARLEVGGPLAEGDDLSRAHKGPRHGHEAQDEPLLGRGELREGEVCEAGVSVVARRAWNGARARLGQ